MKCPCCGKALTMGQELLYKLEDVYYCPHCLVRIAGWPDEEKEAEEESKKVRADETELGESDGLPKTAAEPVLGKSTV